jgi:hypothetical protein
MLFFMSDLKFGERERERERESERERERETWAPDTWVLGT